MATRALLTDFDGVIRHWPPGAFAERGTCLPEGTVREVAFSSPCFASALKGIVLDEVWRADVLTTLLRSYPASDATLALQQWSDPCAQQIDGHVLELLQCARRSLPLVLITNATTRLSSDLSFLNLTNAFDIIVSSADLGVAKPSAAIFCHALDRIGCAPNEALFIDDTIGHVVAARELGLTALHFQDRRVLASILGKHGLIDQFAPVSHTHQGLPSLRRALQDSRALMDALRCLRQLELPDAYLAAGAVRSTYWAARHGYPDARRFEDLDVVFFDRMRDADDDRALERQLERLGPGGRWEVTNQAHVHTWYEAYTGLAIEPLPSTLAGIALWPELATCVAVRLADDDSLVFAAPHGLDDLLALRWRANPRCPDPSAFERRLAQKQVAQRWPLVTIEHGANARAGLVKLDPL